MFLKYIQWAWKQESDNTMVLLHHFYSINLLSVCNRNSSYNFTKYSQ